MYDEQEVISLYKRIHDLEKQLHDEREEHKEIYRNMRANLMELYSNKTDSNLGNDFIVFHLNEEIKRLTYENSILKKSLD